MTDVLILCHQSKTKCYTAAEGGQLTLLSTIEDLHWSSNTLCPLCLRFALRPLALPHLFFLDPKTQIRHGGITAQSSLKKEAKGKAALKSTESSCNKEIVKSVIQRSLFLLLFHLHTQPYPRIHLHITSPFPPSIYGRRAVLHTTNTICP